ncbi:hypothetical protein ACFSQ3_11030 [Sphingobacterium corticis]|uniref:Lipoprotein n=1 Tax=Sphingobacterium corticis TaxID=1812823 RepID=A0ABW5NLA7_9SPHI
MDILNLNRRDKAYRKSKVLNAHSILVAFLMVVNCLCGYSQQEKYIVLTDTLDTKNECENQRYYVKSFTFNTKELYRKEYPVKVYNIIFPEKEGRNELLVLFSLLPDFKTGKLWESVDRSDISGDILHLESLESLFLEPIGYGNYDIKRKFFNEYILLQEIDGKYYKSKNCLMEVFSIKKSLTVFPLFYGHLNLRQDFLTIKEFSKLYGEYYPQYLGELPISFNAAPNYQDGWRVWKEFLSKTGKIGDKKAYHFWCAAATNIADAYDISRGVERFMYVEGLGIIAGSYDFYFRKLPHALAESLENVPKPNNLTDEEWMENVMEEKVMLAEELKCKVSN